jgi:type I restriction enzyme S subunit
MATTTKAIYENAPLAFGVELTDTADRLDCAWFDPIVMQKIEQLRAKQSTNRKLVKLRIVADVGGGKRLPKGTVIQESEAAVIPYIRGMDVKSLKVNVDAAAKIPMDVHQGIQAYQLKKDDLALTIVGAIGEVGIVEDDVEVCDFTENVARVRAKDPTVLTRFLLHCLDSDFGKMQSNRFSVGSLQYKLSLQSCREIEVYLPASETGFDIIEQKRSLESVYSRLSEVDSA